MQGFVLCHGAWATRPRALADPHDSSGTTRARTRRKQSNDAAFLPWNDSISLWLSAAFFHPRTKNEKMYGQGFYVLTLKPEERHAYCHSSLTNHLHEEDGNKKAHETRVEWRKIGQAGCFALIKTNKTRVRGLEAKRKRGRI